MVVLSVPVINLVCIKQIITDKCSFILIDGNFGTTAKARQHRISSRRCANVGITMQPLCCKIVRAEKASYESDDDRVS